MFSHDILTKVSYSEIMDLDADISRGLSTASRFWTLFSIVIWVICAAVSLILSSLSSRSDNYNPYWAQEGESGNIPALKHKT